MSDAPAPPVQTQETLAGLAAAICGCNGNAHNPGLHEECAYALRSAELVLDAGWVSPADHARALTEAASEFVVYVERKWSGGTGHTATNRWVSHAELRKHAEAFSEERAIWRQADEQCAFDPTPNPFRKGDADD